MTLLSIPNKLLKAGLMSLCLLSPAALAVDSQSNGNNDAQFEQSQLSEAQLAQMLAPIALYPDSLLTHILIAATYPLEIVQARRWEQQNSSLSSSQKMQQAEQQDWDPSVMALVAFPTVLEKLNEDLDWTQELGEAFLQDEETVLASIQTLRHQADEANSFDDMENMTITREEKQIIIEPARTEVVYVPYYDPRIVYGSWRWNAYPPVYWRYPSYVHYRPNRPIYWGPSVYINFNYFFGAVHWSSRRVVVINHHKTRYYRKPHKIAYSQGSHRWNHKPAHRRGVAYKAPRVSHKYDRARYNKSHKLAHSQKPGHKGKPAQLHNSKPSHIAKQQRVNKALKNNHNAKPSYSSRPSTKPSTRPSTKPSNTNKMHNGQQDKALRTANKSQPNRSNKAHQSQKATKQPSSRQATNRQVTNRQATSRPTVNKQQSSKHYNQTARVNNNRSAQNHSIKPQQRASNTSHNNRGGSRSSSHHSSSKQRVK
ncbi:DUF3300 domain-containing protein [Shewanella sp. 1_MG-2023]|uniref:DUF3300 domain-containing protein n=1 Tax=unclassified Shewanella TaxID=196818 RepID=UPI0026E19F4E|nr:MULTISPECIES: DUF3300 domain-containing protein [unclassified Shewanella]MDO6613119.1 DUF3300 domain-containing protein [Shewanella sp. 7_MG-2023]MDO6772988.1 DUF3300 domain-containing protein [Shewanella sp. 2_MG-2023]MDO6796237.1 DUF3300 domain-containing protein [Shewanella sp. 1_MG-2023]